MAATIEIPRRSFTVDGYHAMAQAGIPKVWLIDLAEGGVEPHRRPSAPAYNAVERLGSGDALEPEALPDVTVPVKKVL